MFKDILIELLSEKNLNMAQFAKLADISKSTISGWLNENKKPDYDALAKLSVFFNVSADYLLGLRELE